MTQVFEIIGDITDIETIAVDHAIREIARLREQYGTGRWRKLQLKSMKTHYVICIDNSDYPASLALHKVYRVLPDEDAARDGDLRVIDESGEDYLYPASCFVPVEVSEEVEPLLASSLTRALQPA